MIKAKITNIFFDENKQLWFIDCTCFQNGNLKEEYRNIFLKYENRLPKIGEIVILYENISIGKMFATPINDFKNKFKSGESIIGQIDDNNYLLFSNNNIENSINTNNFNIKVKQKAIIEGTLKINLKTASTNISKNISLERKQDKIRLQEIIKVLTSLKDITELLSAKPVIESAINTINSSHISSEALKIAFDLTYDS